MLRSATRETRLTESTSAALSTRATVRCSLGNSERTLGKSPSSSRVVVRRTPPPAEPSKPMMPSPAPPAPGEREGDRDLGAAGERLGGVGEHLRRHQRGRVDVGGTRVTRSARAGRAGTGRSPASRSSRRRARARTPVSTGSMSSRPAAVTAWATACAKRVAADRPARLGHLGQRRVVLDRHRLQAEPRRAAGQRDLGALDAHLHRLVRQAAADVGEQAAGDQCPALVADVGVQRGPGRGLVVEGGQLEAVQCRSSKEPASISRPASTGALGRIGSARAVQATASARTSRSTRNFTDGSSPSGAPSCCRGEHPATGASRTRAEPRCPHPTVLPGCCSARDQLGIQS